MIYTSEILNQALQELGSTDIKERKKAASLFMRAACKELGTKDKKEAIMIGDSLSADIQGGINFGIDTCWVNLLGKDENPEIKAKYKVDKLSELYEII